MLSALQIMYNDKIYFFLKKTITLLCLIIKKYEAKIVVSKYVSMTNNKILIQYNFWIAAILAFLNVN